MLSGYENSVQYMRIYYLWFVRVWLNCFSCVQLFVTPWPVACQAPLSMGFSRQENWIRLPFPPPGIFPTQGWNPRLLRWLLFLIIYWLHCTSYGDLSSLTRDQAQAPSSGSIGSLPLDHQKSLCYYFIKFCFGALFFWITRHTLSLHVG